MINFPSNIESYENRQLFETSLRRKLFAELSKIKSALDNYSLNDQTTQSIRIWHENFLKCLRLERIDESTICDNFIALLQQILIEPIFHSPLDEEPLLGSDGKTYSSKALKLYLHTVPEQYKYRSPLNIEDETPFTIQPHPIMKELISWLKSHDKMLPCTEIEEKLKRFETSIQLPTELNHRISNLRNRLRERQQMAQNDFLASIEMRNRAFMANVQNVRAQMESIRQRTAAIAQERLQEIHEIQEAHENAMNYLREKVNSLSEEIDRLNVENRLLEEKNENIANQINRFERESAQLSHAINETRIAIQEREKSWSSGLLAGLAAIGISVVTTWILQSTGAPPGIYGAFTRAKGGGILNIGIT